MDVVVLWHVFVLLTVRGVFQAFHGPAVFAIVPTMVPKDKLSRMNGISYLFTSGVNLVAPVIAALLLGFLDISQILWIDPATSMAALIPLLLIIIPSVRKEQDKSSFRKQFSEGFAFIKNAKGLLSFIVLATGLNFLLAPLSTLLPYYIKFDHFGAVSDLAFVMAFSQGGMVAGGLLMSVVTGFKRKMVVIISAIYILFVGYIMIALTPTGLFWFMAASGLIITFCFPIIDVLIMTMLQTVVPVEMQGRITSVTMSLAHAAQPAGMVISGVVAIFTGTANLFLGCAGLGILLVTLSWIFTDVRHVGKTEKP
jgi:DHA3 family macrolide efflux protein-like MFS transporter